jgi:hypothetical protein
MRQVIGGHEPIFRENLRRPSLIQSLWIPSNQVLFGDAIFFSFRVIAPNCLIIQPYTGRELTAHPLAIGPNDALLLT